MFSLEINIRTFERIVCCLIFRYWTIIGSVLSGWWVWTTEWISVFKSWTREWSGFIVVKGNCVCPITPFGSVALCVVKSYFLSSNLQNFSIEFPLSKNLVSILTENEFEVIQRKMFHHFQFWQIVLFVFFQLEMQSLYRVEIEVSWFFLNFCVNYLGKEIFFIIVVKEAVSGWVDHWKSVLYSL